MKKTLKKIKEGQKGFENNLMHKFLKDICPSAFFKPDYKKMCSTKKPNHL
jgi:hypothetical protein